MCGRYALYGPTSRIREQFDLDHEFDFAPHYNIAPTTKALVVHSGSQSVRVASLYRWGLIPVWAKDTTIGAKLINARGETVAEKPAFRAPFVAADALCLPTVSTSGSPFRKRVAR
jgi:putative SOS response-associated peptidase YedK